MCVTFGAYLFMFYQRVGESTIADPDLSKRGPRLEAKVRLI